MDSFRFTVPLDIDVSKGSKSSKRRIFGYASTESVDGEEEKVIQAGLDLSYFLKRGWLNYNHQNHLIIGYPTQASVDRKGMRMEGELLEEVEMADHVWTLARALKKSGGPRKLGLSIEGKVIERAEKVIKKARVYNVAITPHPMNPDATFDVMAKSMLSCKCEGDACTRDELIRSLDAGYQTDSAAATGGGALREESLDKDLKITTWRPEKPLCDYLKGQSKDLCERLMGQKQIEISDAVSFMQLVSGVSRAEAERLVAKLENPRVDA